jgi:hypothetical protein
MYGCIKNSPALIQEAQVLGGKRIAYYEKYPNQQANIFDDYKVNTMALIRLKEWSKAIAVTKRAFNKFTSEFKIEDDANKNYVRKL